MAAIGFEAGGAVLFDQVHRQLTCRPAYRHRSSQEGGGVFLGRSTPEVMPDDVNQFWLPLDRTTQIASKEISLSFNITPLVPAIQERFQRCVVDQPIWQSKAGQATDGHPAIRAAEPPHPECNRLASRIGGVTLVVSMGPESMEATTVRALRGRTHLCVVLLPDIRLHRQLYPYDLLHPITIQRQNEIERYKSYPLRTRL